MSVEKLKEHFRISGKTDSWLRLANQFNITPNGSNKQKSDKVRRIFNSIKPVVPKVHGYEAIWIDPNSIPKSQGGYREEFEPYETIGSMFVQTLPLRPQPEVVTTTTGTLYSSKGVQNCEIEFPNKISKINSPNYPIDRGFFVPMEQFIQSPFETNLKKYIPKGIHLVLGCVHVPFHNKIVLDKIINLIKDNKDKILGFHLIGDFMDMKSLSSHDEKIIDKSGWSLGKEYQEGNKVLDLLDKYLPKNTQKTFLYGNHCSRYFRYINNIKNYKTADAIQSPTQALKLNERGYLVLENWKEDYITVGKYQLLHGVFCTQNPAKSHVDKLRESCIFAHTHRVGQHYENNLHGVNIGCLADLNSDCFSYLSRLEKLNWKNGFGIINIDDRESHAEVIVVENDSFWFGGKKY